MAVTHSRYELVTVSLPKRFRNGRFNSETAVRRFQNLNRHLDPEVRRCKMCSARRGARLSAAHQGARPSAVRRGVRCTTCVLCATAPTLCLPPHLPPAVVNAWRMGALIVVAADRTLRHFSLLFAVPCSQSINASRSLQSTVGSKLLLAITYVV
jgi:hypothetical protein